jgi:hypothetical protein
MADVETDNEGDTNPHPFNVTANPNPASQSNTANVSQSQNDQIPSLNNPIRFTKVDDDDSENDDKKPSHQGHGLPEIAMTKIQKVRMLEHNDTDPSGWKQALAYQLIPYALEWLLDSEIPRPPKSHPSYERWKKNTYLCANLIFEIAPQRRGLQLSF